MWLLLRLSLAYLICMLMQCLTVCNVSNDVNQQNTQGGGFAKDHAKWVIKIAEVSHPGVPFSSG